MRLFYQLNPELKVTDIADLRCEVGWEPREDKIEKTIDQIYLTAACFDGSCLVGYVEVISDGVEDALVRNLLVHPGYRRQGIALKLLKLLVESIEKNGIKTVNVLFEPELARLYRKAGFRIIGGGLIDNEAKEL